MGPAGTITSPALHRAAGFWALGRPRVARVPASASLIRRYKLTRVRANRQFESRILAGDLGEGMESEGSTAIVHNNKVVRGTEAIDDAAFHSARDALITDIVQVPRPSMPAGPRW